MMARRANILPTAKIGYVNNKSTTRRSATDSNYRRRRWCTGFLTLRHLLLFLIGLALCAIGLLAHVAVQFAHADSNDTAARSPNPPSHVQTQQQQHFSYNPADIDAASFTAKSVEDLRKAWPEWAPCDPAIAFEQRCHPKPTTCHESRHVSSTHGIGNALITTYQQPAKEVFTKKEEPRCAPRLVDDLRKGLTFRLLDYVYEPNVTLGPNSVDDKSCILHAITQPREPVMRRIERLQADYSWYPPGTTHKNSGSDTKPQIPLVGLHVRTGWADELSRRSFAWDALGNCTEYRDLYGANAAENVAGTAIQGLVEIVLQTQLAANDAFGVGRWRAFVASDAPAVKVYASRIFSNDNGGKDKATMYFTGQVWHNNNKFSGGRPPSDNEEAAELSLADLVVLSMASMILSKPSKFPESAILRSVCPQRTITLHGHPRHGLAKMGTLLVRALQKRTPNNNENGAEKEEAIWIPNLGEEDRKELEEWLPGGRDHLCMKDAYPDRACMCFIKLGHSTTD